MDEAKFPTEEFTKEEKPQERKFPPLVVKKEADEKDWKDESNENLKKRGSPNRVLNINHLLVLSVIIAIGVIAFIYFTYSGYYKPVLNSTCINTCSPCPESPDCNCDLDCGNVTLKFPPSFTLNIDSLNITKYNSTCLAGCLNSS